MKYIRTHRVPTRLTHIKYHTLHWLTHIKYHTLHWLTHIKYHTPHCHGSW